MLVLSINVCRFCITLLWVVVCKSQYGVMWAMCGVFFSLVALSIASVYYFVSRDVQTFCFVIILCLNQSIYYTMVAINSLCGLLDC